MAISNSRLQFLLSQSDVFRGRVAVMLCTQAGVVLAETTSNTNHAARAAYAKSVITNPVDAAVRAAVELAQSANVGTTITMEDEGVRTSVTDAQLFAQVSADWNKLAGIDSGN